LVATINVRYPSFPELGSSFEFANDGPLRRHALGAILTLTDSLGCDRARTLRSEPTVR
jgi:hypothetical protein